MLWLAEPLEYRGKNSTGEQNSTDKASDSSLSFALRLALGAQCRTLFLMAPGWLTCIFDRVFSRHFKVTNHTF